MKTSRSMRRASLSSVKRSSYRELCRSPSTEAANQRSALRLGVDVFWIGACSYHLNRLSESRSVVRTYTGIDTANAKGGTDGEIAGDIGALSTPLQTVCFFLVEGVVVRQDLSTEYAPDLSRDSVPASHARFTDEVVASVSCALHSTKKVSRTCVRHPSLHVTDDTASRHRPRTCGRLSVSRKSLSVSPTVYQEHCLDVEFGGSDPRDIGSFFLSARPSKSSSFT
jgi:hypothetical protein